MTSPTPKAEVEDALDTYANWVITWSEGVTGDAKYKSMRQSATQQLELLIERAKVEGAIGELERVYRSISEFEELDSKWLKSTYYDRLTHLKTLLNEKEK